MFVTHEYWHRCCGLSLIREIIQQLRCVIWVFYPTSWCVVPHSYYLFPHRSIKVLLSMEIKEAQINMRGFSSPLRPYVHIQIWRWLNLTLCCSWTDTFNSWERVCLTFLVLSFKCHATGLLAMIGSLSLGLHVVTICLECCRLAFWFVSMQVWSWNS